MGPAIGLNLGQCMEGTKIGLKKLSHNIPNFNLHYVNVDLHKFLGQCLAEAL